MNFSYNTRAAWLFAVLLGSFAASTSTCLAQGGLTPPGAPAPTFKTLAQVEPRFPISTYQTNLTVSGSYYLTTNLFSGTNSFDAINIRTNISNITIDLNGFAIVCTVGAGVGSPVGVRISEGTNIVVRNGFLSGFDRAIRAEGLFYGVVAENLHISACRRTGIEGNGVPGDATQTIAVRNCIVEGNDGAGEAASVTVDGMTFLNCTVVVRDCIIRDIVGVGTGIGNCLDLASVTNSIIDNNFMANADIGLKSTGAGTRVYYRNNLAAGIATPFSVAGGVDRGGNN